jgi:uncharacterized protein YeaO (DUF488 family)
MNVIKIKRIYEKPSEDDGYRVLVDRLWPRGVSKEAAFIDEWAKEVTPSTEIRKEFNHNPDFMENFRHKYIFELDNNEDAKKFVMQLKRKLEEVNVTLLYAAKSEKINHAVILKEWLNEHIRRK